MIQQDEPEIAEMDIQEIIEENDGSRVHIWCS